MIDLEVPKTTAKVSSSFIGLNAYSEKQASMFFGRDDEIKTLYKLIKTHTITIVFGKSGTGKTSLLNAGVFPKLREDYCLPFRIRLDFSDTSPDLLTQVKQVLRTEIDSVGFKVESYPGEETLWEYFHKEPLWNIITPILVFDQFEEIFTLASKSSRFKKEELDVFIDELSDLVENSIPEKIKHRFINSNDSVALDYGRQKAKIIFAFREDFLAEIESITARIPSVKHSRFRLKAMNSEQAYEVITKTWGAAIHPSEAKKIVQYLTDEPSENTEVMNRFGTNDLVQIEPSLLSQICLYLDKKRGDEQRLTISADFLDKYPKNVILRSIYDEVLDEAREVVTAGSQPKVQEFIEDDLITDEGYRTKYAVKEIDNELLPAINIFKKKYFIREEDDAIELTHDVIVSLVKTDRETRRKNAALIAAKKRAQKRFRALLIIAFIVGVAIWAAIVMASLYQKRMLEIDNEALREDSIALASRKSELGNINSGLQKLIDKKMDLLKNGSKAGKATTTSNQDSAGMNNIVHMHDSIVSALNYQLADINRKYDAANISIKTYQQDLVFLKSDYEQKQGQQNQQWEKKLADKQTEIEKSKTRLQWNIDLLARQFKLLQLQRDSLYSIVQQPSGNWVFDGPSEVKDPINNKLKKAKKFGYGFDYANAGKQKK
jgi:hypothetical protein